MAMGDGVPVSEGPAAAAQIEVQVVAIGAGQTVPAMPFKMKPSTIFGKLMNAWCTHHKMPVERALFTIGDCEVRPGDTPEILCLRPSSTPVTVNVKPRKTKGSVDAGHSAKQSLGVANHGDASDTDSPSPDPNSPTEQMIVMGDAGDVTDGADDTSADCDASTDREGNSDAEGVAPADSRIAKPVMSRSPSPLGSPVQPPAKRRRNMTELGEAAGPTDVVGAEPAPGEDRKVRFIVIAECEDGQRNLQRFTMGPETPMVRLTRGWCLQTSLKEDSVEFRIKDYTLKAGDTPMSLAVASVISEHLVGVTPLRPDFEDNSMEVEVRVVRKQRTKPAVEPAARQRRPPSRQPARLTDDLDHCL